MKANELRIGNYLIDNESEAISDRTNMMDSIITVFSIWNTDRFDYYVGRKVGEIYENAPITEFSPIPLTEDWLFRFGFTRDRNGYWLTDRYSLCFAITKDNEFLPCWLDRVLFPGGTDKFRTIKYVHELQNLYFALTAQELILDVES